MNLVKVSFALSANCADCDPKELLESKVAGVYGDQGKLESVSGISGLSNLHFAIVQVPYQRGSELEAALVNDTEGRFSDVEAAKYTKLERATLIR